MVNSLVQMRSLWQQYPTAELPERLAMWEHYTRNEPLNKSAPLKPLPATPEPASVEPEVAQTGGTELNESGSAPGSAELKANGAVEEGQKKKKAKKVAEEAPSSKGSPEKKGPKSRKGGEAAAKGEGESVKKVKRKQAPKEETPPAPKKAKLDLEKDPEAEPASQNPAPLLNAASGALSPPFQPLKVLAAVRGALLGYSRDAAPPSLSTSDVESAVRQTPGDPAVLAADPPGLTEIVRAALRALSTKPVDLGTKKALAKFERETKEWAWTGPRPLADEDLTGAGTSAAAWRIDPEFQKQVLENFLTRLKQPKKEPVSQPEPSGEKAPGGSAADRNESGPAEVKGEPGGGGEDEGAKKQVKRRVKKEEGQEKGGQGKAVGMAPGLKSTPEQVERFQKEEWTRYAAPEKAFR
jgi:hypothetical protein